MQEKQERVNQTHMGIIGSNIKKMRVEKGLRASDVIAKLQLLNISISSTSFSKIEHGVTNPSVALLVGLTRVLNCDFNDFSVGAEKYLG